MCELLPVGLRSVEVVSSWRTEAQRKTQGLEGASGRAFSGGNPYPSKNREGRGGQIETGPKGRQRARRPRISALSGRRSARAGWARIVLHCPTDQTLLGQK